VHAVLVAEFGFAMLERWVARPSQVEPAARVRSPRTPASLPLQGDGSQPRAGEREPGRMDASVRSGRLSSELPAPPVPACSPGDNPPPVDSRDLFEILTREHIDSVRAFLLSTLRDNVAAEDVLQETFLVAWRILDRYDRKLPFGPWVRGIAAKLVLNHRRKLGRSRVHYCDDEVLSRIDDSFREFARLQGDTFGEKLDALRDCLSVLSGAQRESIKMHYELGMHCKEIADRLGIGFEAVKKHLQRGRAQLHRCLRSKLPEGEVA
jgi:RNA polymerase sigma-70 factor (ECF subfamily)